MSFLSIVKSSAAINLPLREGHAPSYLIRRMMKLCYAVTKIIVNERGQQEFSKEIIRPIEY